MRGLSIMFCLVAIAFPAVANSQSDFHGYPCTGDCSGHEAGYDWAERNGIADPDECGGNSDSFVEGCQAYGEEQQEEQDPDEDQEDSGVDGED